ncbi:hypothetical protein HMPREF1578_00937 [Gardnerella pickettii JCP8017B]|nr:hypothetical protein HMPREF1578_00937 [Gardnerella pickettii JCP8017B]
MSSRFSQMRYVFRGCFSPMRYVLKAIFSQMRHLGYVYSIFS